MSVMDIFETMEYGPAPESDSVHGLDMDSRTPAVWPVYQ